MLSTAVQLQKLQRQVNIARILAGVLMLCAATLGVFSANHGQTLTAVTAFGLYLTNIVQFYTLTRIDTTIRLLQLTDELLR